MFINYPKITVVIADDHDIVRAGLVSMLSSQPQFVVLAESCNGFEAVEMADLHKPDILIADNQMPGHDGIEVARHLRERGHHLSIIMLTMYGHHAYVRRAFRAGINGYVLKDHVASEILPAIEAVLQGDKYLSSRLGDAMTIDRLLSQTEYKDEDPLWNLTERERTVFHGVIRGMSNLRIAEALTISPRTVETHRMNMMAKLGIPTKDRLIVFAIAKGLIEIDTEGNIFGEPFPALHV
ncbi:response regulator transcription factor [bacterium]|nr:response regulator transcription factor [bacterium]